MKKIRIKKQIVAAVCAGILMTAGFTGCSGTQDGSGGAGDTKISAEAGKTEVLKVGNEKVTQAEAYIYMIQCAYTYAVDQATFKDSEEDYRSQILQQIRSSKSKYQVAQQTGIEITDEDQKEIDANVDKYYKSFTEDLLDHFGITRDDVEKLFTEEKYTEKLNEKANSDLTENYTKEGKEKFGDKTFIDVDYTIFPYVEVDSEGKETKYSDDKIAEQKQKAEEFRQKILEGSDFDTLAKEYGVEDTTDKERTYIGATGDKMDAVLSKLQNGEIAELYDDGSRYMVMRMNNNNDTDYRDFFIETYASQMAENAYSTMEQTWLQAMNVSDDDFIGDTWDKMDFAGLVKYMDEHNILSDTTQEAASSAQDSTQEAASSVQDTTQETSSDTQDATQQ